MRQLLFITVLLVSAATASAQVKFRVGARAGLATSDVQTGDVSFSNDGRDFALKLEDARYSIHGGLFMQLRLNKLVLQPEVLFNSSRTDYRLQEFTNAEVIESVRSENYQYVDVPFMVGYKWGPLRLQLGPVAHMFVSSNSELNGVADYEALFEKASMGYQAGVGLDFWNVLLDFKYQSAFEQVGDHITFGGQPVNFETTPSQLVMSVGLSFN